MKLFSIFQDKSFLNDSELRNLYEECLQVRKENEEFLLTMLKGKKNRQLSLILFQMRTFAINFPIIGYLQARGERGKAEADPVFRYFLSENWQGMCFRRSRRLRIGEELLQEQFQALLSEKNNVGSGQYALAAIAIKILESSSGQAWIQDESGDFSSYVGNLIGRNCAAWAKVYQRVSGRPMQEYLEGFQPSERDIINFENNA